MARRATRSKRIEVIDVDLASDTPWSDALGPTAARGRTLLRAFDEQGRSEVPGWLWLGLQGAAGILHSLLGNEHGEEIDDIAEALDASASEIVLANAAYDIANVGCSTIAARAEGGPLHARNLDWPFPRGLLRRDLVVTRMRNAPCGDYALVTWPGMFGALTGIAPGRFSVTVNFVEHEDESGRLDWRR